MKTVVTYFLLLALTLQSFYRGIMAMEYQIHLPEYLAKCINKDKPRLHCNGQCALMKKIKEKERQETKKNMLVYEYSSLYVHKERVKVPMVQVDENMGRTNYFSYLRDYHFEFNTPIFRPPAA